MGRKPGRPATRKTPESVAIGARLRHERESVDVAIEAMAGALGVDQSTYRRIESGDVALGAHRAHVAATMLGISVARLHGDIPAAQSPAPDAA